MFEHDLNFKMPLRRAEICDGELPEQDSRTGDAVSATAAQIEHAETTVVLTKIAEALQNIELKLEPIAKELSAIAIGLAKMMVEKMVGESDELQAKRLSLVLLKTLSQAEPVLGIYLNPHNLHAVEKQSDWDSGSHKVELLADDNVPKGECRVEFDSHDLVSSLECQLDEVEARLQELLDED